MEKTKSIKNETIQIYRIIATSMICFLHYQLAFNFWPLMGKEAYIMVDFFCILSGYLIAEKHEKHDKNYLIRRFIRLYFVYVIPCLILTGYYFNENKSLKWILDYILKHLPEFCMVDWIIPNMENRIVPVLWYIPFLFFSTFIIWELLDFLSLPFRKLFSLLISVGIYNYFYINTGHIDVWPFPSKFYFNDGLLRVIAGTFLGVFCYAAVKKMSSFSCPVSLKIFIGLNSFCLQVVICFLLLFDRWRWGDFICIFIFAVNVIIAFWSQLLVGNNKVIDALARLCYPIYAIHFVVYTIMSDNGFREKAPLYTSCVFIFSVVLSSILLYNVSFLLTRRF